jgi:hypothetical protein
MTIWAAKANFLEKETGSLEKNKKSRLYYVGYRFNKSLGN